MVVKYVDYLDQWGRFRSVALPQTSLGGRKYLACADLEIGYIESLYWKGLLQSSLLVMPLLLLTLPFVFLVHRGFVGKSARPSPFRESR